VARAEVEVAAHAHAVGHTRVRSHRAVHRLREHQKVELVVEFVAVAAKINLVHLYGVGGGDAREVVEEGVEVGHVLEHGARDHQVVAPLSGAQRGAVGVHANVAQEVFGARKPARLAVALHEGLVDAAEVALVARGDVEGVVALDEARAAELREQRHRARVAGPQLEHAAAAEERSRVGHEARVRGDLLVVGHHAVKVVDGARALVRATAARHVAEAQQGVGDPGRATEHEVSTGVEGRRRDRPEKLGGSHRAERRNLVSAKGAGQRLVTRRETKVAACDRGLMPDTVTVRRRGAG